MTTPKGRKTSGSVKLEYRDAYAHVKFYLIQHRGRKVKRSEVITDLKDGNFKQGEHFPKSPEGVGEWIKILYKTLDEYNIEELFKWYDPTYTHNNNYWKAVEAPYQFSMDEKVYLFNWYRNVEGFIFMPLSSKPRILVIEAIWVCRLVNMNPNWSNRPIDLFLWAKGLSVLEHLHGYESEEVKIALTYLTHAPFNDINSQNNYIELVRYNRVTPVENIWPNITKTNKYSKDYLLEWYIDYPLIYGANFSSWEWLYPHEKMIGELSRICLGWFNSKQFRDHRDDPDNKGVFNLVAIDDMVARISNIRTRVDFFKGKDMDVFKMSDVARQSVLNAFTVDGTELDFDVSLFDRYYRLLNVLFEVHHQKRGVFVEGMQVPMADTIEPRVVDLFNEPKKMPMKFPLPYKLD